MFETDVIEPETAELTLADVREAAHRIYPFVRRTPLVLSQTLSEKLGTNVYLKLELFQKTGAFKVRGAFSRMLTLTPDQRRRGVVAVSGGNHAQAVAYAARELGVDATVLMPEFTPSNYLEATSRYGATVRLLSSMRDAFTEVRAYEREGFTYIHPFDDPLVIAGQGTVGLEIMDDLPEVTDVILSVGGGGLAGGVATAVKGQNAAIRVWGVETDGADSMAQALAAGRIIELPQITSVARTLGAPAVAERTLELAQRLLEGVTVVSDAEAINALRFLLERVKVFTEPAASCTLAAAERLRDRFSPDSNVVLVLCGGNMCVDDFCQWGLSNQTQVAAVGSL